MQKIGIMGGTFNPIHFGHLFIAEEVKDVYDLDEILFIPTGTPPHKSNANILDGKIRYQLAKLAVQTTDYFSVSSIEVDRTGYSYSIDTLKSLHEDRPDVKWYFILGADAFLYLEKWKRIEEVHNYCEFIVVARPGYNQNELICAKDKLNKNYSIESHLINIEGINISSTTIRKRCNKNRSIKYLLPESVREYILKNSYYGDE